jgi:predicted DNA-binding transcriptional regulator YafY
VARSTRLLMLLQTLRGRSRPVTASALAAELGVSERTLYRDIADLIAQGAPIYGEAGVGYVLRPGLFLPPLMLTEDETEAIVLGLRYVDQRGDEVLAKAAAVALAKLAPSSRRQRKKRCKIQLRCRGRVDPAFRQTRSICGHFAPPSDRRGSCVSATSMRRARAASVSSGRSPLAL